MRVKCPKCKGKGTVPIRRELQETLATMRSLLGKAGGVTVKRLYAALGDETIGETAVNKRLEDLRALKLVRREREGKHYLYFV